LLDDCAPPPGPGFPEQAPSHQIVVCVKFEARGDGLSRARSNISSRFLFIVQFLPQ
jgi:hypothetical protein